MKLIDSTLREQWVVRFEEHGGELRPRESLLLLSTVSSDPRLQYRSVESIKEIKEIVSVISKGIADLNVDRFGVTDPESLQNEFARDVASELLQQTGHNETSVDEVVSPASMEIVTDRGDEQQQDAKSAAVVQASEAGQEEQSSPETSSSESSEDEFTQEAINLSVFDRLTDRYDISPVLVDYLGLGDTSPDLSWLESNRERLDELLRNGSPGERAIAGAGFCRLAVEDPSLVTPYLEHLKQLFQSDIKGTTRLGLVIYLLIARETPDELLGHLDPLWSQFGSDDERNQEHLFDIVERISDEHVHPIVDQTDMIARGLNHSVMNIRRDAALTLWRIIDVDAEAVVPYTGALVDQVEYADRSGVVAAATIAKLSEEAPNTIAPYSRRIVESLDSEVGSLQKVALLRTLRDLLADGVFDITDPNPIIAHLDTDDPRVVATALTTLNELARYNPELCTSGIDRYVEFLGSDDEQVAKAASLLLSTLSDAMPTRLTSHTAGIVNQLGTNEFVDRHILGTLSDISETDSDAVIPHLETIAPYLNDDATTLVLATRIFGYISREAPGSILPYLDPIQETLTTCEPVEAKRPLLDAIANTAEESPESVQISVATIVDEIDPDDEQTTILCLQALRRLADTKPAEIAAHFDQILPLLTAGSEPVREIVVPVVGETVKQDIENREESLEWLLAGIQNETIEVTSEAIIALAPIAEADPELVSNVPVEEYLDEDDPEMQSAGIAVVSSLGKQDGVDLSEYMPVLIENLEHESVDVELMSLRGVKILVQSQPELVTQHIDAVLPHLDDDADLARRAASDILERVARVHPESLIPYVDTIVEKLSDDHPGVVRDALLSLGYIGEENPDQVEPHLTKIQERLTADEELIQRAASASLAFIAREEPSLAARATELIADQLDPDAAADQVDPQSIAATTVFYEIANEDPSRVAPHLSSVIPILEVDDETIQQLAISVIGHTSSATSNGIEDELETIVATGREVEMDAAVADVLRNVSAENPDLAIEYVDHLLEISMSDTDMTSTLALLALSNIAFDHPSPVADHIEKIAEYLTADSAGKQAGAAAVVGAISNSDPSAVEPYVAELCDCLDDFADVSESESGVMRVLPIVDALRNVAKEHPDAVEPHLDSILSHSPADDEAAQILQDLRSIYEEDEESVTATETSMEAEYRSRNVQTDPTYDVENNIKQMAEEAVSKEDEDSLHT